MKAGGILAKAKQIYYNNELIKLAFSKHLKEISCELESFNITHLLHYLMELYSIRAAEREVTLELFVESCFPKSVTAEKRKFELLFSTILSYFLDFSHNDLIKVYARLKNPIEDGFNLAFEFESSQTEEIIESNLLHLFSSNENAGQKLTNEHPSNECKNSVYSKQFKEIVTWIKGNVEIGSREDKRVFVHLEMPFGIFDQTKPNIASIAPLGVVSSAKVNEYTTRWTLKQEVPVETLKLDLMENASRSMMSNDALLVREFADKSKGKVDDSKTKEMVKAKLKLVQLGICNSPQVRTAKRLVLTTMATSKLCPTASASDIVNNQVSTPLCPDSLPKLRTSQKRLSEEIKLIVPASEAKDRLPLPGLTIEIEEEKVSSHKSAGSPMEFEYIPLI